MHNCWDYVYYIGYLNSTAYEDLVDYADVYVKKMIESNKFEWFPCYFRENSKDLSIASPIQGISSRLDTLEKNIIETKNSITEIKESNKETKESITEMKESITEIKESNKETKESITEMKESITEIKESNKEMKESNRETKESIIEMENRIENRFGKIEEMLSQILASQNR